MELFLICGLAIATGIFAGLLPALPVFTGPLLLFMFAPSDLSLLHMLLFWLISYSGTQFFGSIATITTRIPGEESAVIYLEDINKLNHDQKKKLLFDTACGSWFAASISIIIVWAVVTFMNPSILPALLSNSVQLTVYLTAICLLIFINSKPFYAFLLIMLAALLAPKQNYALPDMWYSITELFSGYTLYMVVLGTIIIPMLFDKNDDPKYPTGNEISKPRIPNILTVFKSTLIGIVAGLIPGPSASMATTFAYKTNRGSIFSKILSAETANNASVVIVAIPFFILALPTNQNTLLMSNLMDLRSTLIVDQIPYLINKLTIIFLMVMLLYFYLSTHLINWYANTVRFLHDKMKFILGAILLGLISFDLSYSNITWDRYAILLLFFALLGFLLRKYKISPVPFLFSIVLSDKLIWLIIQNLY